MSTPLQRRVDKLIRLFDDLAATLPAKMLASHLGELRSNTIGQQLWCVVGGRETWAKAIPDEEWPGFASSLEDPHDPEQVRAALQSSAEQIRAVLVPDLSERSEELALGLLEHESGHAGQLLRYVLGLKLDVPKSWERYFAL